MKKLLSLLFLLLLSNVVTAQYFPGKHYRSFLGKKVKIVTKGSYYYDVYKKPSTRSKHYAEVDGHTPKQALEDKVFMVIGFEGETTTGLFFVLSNAETGKVYYDYSLYHEILFDLVPVEDFDFKDEVCSEIRSWTDKFTGEIRKTMSTNYNVYFSRNGNDIYTILKTKSKTLVVGKKGATMLLEDGSKIKDTETEIDVKTVDDGYYEYSVVIRLTPEDIEKLKKSYVTDYRLYIFDESVNSGKICKKLFECILSN